MNLGSFFVAVKSIVLQDPDQRICTSESPEIEDGDGEEGGWAGGEVGGGGGGAQRGEGGGKSAARREGELSAGD